MGIDRRCSQCGQRLRADAYEWKLGGWRCGCGHLTRKLHNPVPKKFKKRDRTPPQYRGKNPAKYHFARTRRGEQRRKARKSDDD